MGRGWRTCSVFLYLLLPATCLPLAYADAPGRGDGALVELWKEPDASAAVKLRGGDSLVQRAADRYREYREKAIEENPPSVPDEPDPSKQSCPRNARYNFCSMDVGCSTTCEDLIAAADAGKSDIQPKPCNRRCYNRCECATGSILLMGYCVTSADCKKVAEARPATRRRVANEILASYDARMDVIPGAPDAGRKGSLADGANGADGASGGASSEFKDDIDALLNAVTGGLWNGMWQNSGKGVDVEVSAHIETRPSEDTEAP